MSHPAMGKTKLLELVNELKNMTPAAPYPCQTEKEIAAIIRIRKIWRMLFDKIYAEYKENPEIMDIETLKEWKKISNDWKRYTKKQRQLIMKRENTLEYNYILGNISIPAFHKNSMVDLRALSYPKEQ